MVSRDQMARIVVGVTAVALAGLAQERGEVAGQSQGEPIGTVATHGELLVMELDEGAVVPANPFDLEGRTVRLTPHEGGYRWETLPLRWDPEFGDELEEAHVSLQGFSFPFSGSRWGSLFVHPHGTIAFGAGPPSVGRFAELREAAPTLVDTEPFISAFLKPRMSGPRFVRELEDRVVVTWDLTEPHGGIFDFAWDETVNRIQAVLHEDGTIELSYREVAAEDAIVGAFPIPATDSGRTVSRVSLEENPEAPGHLDLEEVSLAIHDGFFFEARIRTRAPLPEPRSARLEERSYRVHFRMDEEESQGAPQWDFAKDADVVWTVESDPDLGYVARGPGVSADVEVEGRSLSVSGTLPEEFTGASRLHLSADVVGLEHPRPVFDVLPPVEVSVPGIRSPRVSLSGGVEEGAAVAYEAFHHASRPATQDMACTVIEELGDRFDFLAYFSDFRIDNQESGTPSTGAIGSSVRGIGTGGGRDPASMCSQGRLQATYIQPVYIGSVQGHEEAPDGEFADFDRQMSQMSHELGHRWSAFLTAEVNGREIPLGPTHWRTGLHAPAAYPYGSETEASTMGGSYWQDNEDGTYTQLHRDFFVPAKGFSHLDLYLMGLLPPSEVPDMMVLENLERVGEDEEGNPVFRGDPLTVTIENIVAANGVRLPRHGDARTEFNTGVVGIVLPGEEPSDELLERMEGIRETWIEYWDLTTGGRSSMTTHPHGTVEVDGGGDGP